jgi:hypothetical protein
MSAANKYADSPHPRVLKSRVHSKFEELVDAQQEQEQEQQPGSSASLIVPVVILSSSRRVALPDEADEIPVVNLGGGESLLGESTTDGDPTSPMAPSCSATESTGGNAVDSVESTSEGDPLSPFLSLASSDDVLKGHGAGAAMEPQERAANGTPKGDHPTATGNLAPLPAHRPESAEKHEGTLTPTPSPAMPASEALLSQAVAFSDLLFEVHSGSVRNSLVAPLPMPALTPLPLDLSPSLHVDVRGGLGPTPLSSVSATAVPSPSNPADQEALKAALMHKNPARKSSPLSRAQASPEKLSQSQVPSDISSTDQVRMRACVCLSVCGWVCPCLCLCVCL